MNTITWISSLSTYYSSNLDQILSRSNDIYCLEESMPSFSFNDLPREIIYLICRYLHQEHIAYSFLKVNQYWTSIVKYILGDKFYLTNVKDEKLFQYSLLTLLPSIGDQLRYLTIDYPSSLLTYIDSIHSYCPHLEVLIIHCYGIEDDIRRYITYLLHHQSMSLTLMCNNQIVGEDLTIRLLNQCQEDSNRAMYLAPSLILHLTSMDDLIRLERFSRSSHLSDGYYMIESLSTGEWLTDTYDDLCLLKNKCHYNCIFSIQQIDQCSREYQLFNERTQCRLSVLKPYEDEDEYWFSSSILSNQRKESSRSCFNFTFENIGNNLGFYIRPCYSASRRLQVSGKRIIVSLCNYQTTIDHCFKLHRISDI